MSLDSKVNDILNRMHEQTPIDKGIYGEKAVFTICEEFYTDKGGILVHSYSYKTVPHLPGNIKRVGGKLYIENLGTTTEIDVLLVTPFRIFPIEVKAYKAGLITLYDDRISGCANTEKSPVHQNEMHMRHLYPHIFASLPDGATKYVKPIVVFTDQTRVKDARSKEQKEYITVTILNNLKQVIADNNYPINNTILDLASIEMRLKNVMSSCITFLPYVER